MLRLASRLVVVLLVVQSAHAADSGLNMSAEGNEIFRKLMMSPDPAVQDAMSKMQAAHRRIIDMVNSAQPNIPEIEKEIENEARSRELFQKLARDKTKKLLTELSDSDRIIYLRRHYQPEIPPSFRVGSPGVSDSSPATQPHAPPPKAASDASQD